MLIILLISLFFIILCFLPLRMEIEYIREGKNDEFKLEFIIFYKLLGLRLRIPFIQNLILPLFTEIRAEINSILLKLWPGKKSIKMEEEIDWQKVSLQKLKKLIKIFLDRRQFAIILSSLNLKCESFVWKTEFGLAEPALTGVAAGLIWAFKGQVLFLINENVCYLKNLEVEVKPDFNNNKFEMSFKGIFSLFLGNIIVTGVRLFFYRCKGGFLWQNIQLKN